jgi:hypothetical protein
MRRLHLLPLLILALCARPLQAQEALPPVVREGLEAYRNDGPAAALGTWARNWTDEAREDAMSRMVAGLQDIVQVSGTPIGYDFVGSAVMSPHVRRIYVVLLHSERPAYLRLDVYLVDGAWRVLNLNVNTDPVEVFPVEMLVPRS